MKTVQKKDLWLIVGLLLVAGGFFLWQHLSTPHHSELYAVFRVDGEIIKTVDLNVDQTFTLSNRDNVVFEIRNHQVAFICSDCLDQICVNVGFIGRPGQVAACLPNGVVMYVQGIDPEGEDLDLIL